LTSPRERSDSAPAALSHQEIDGTIAALQHAAAAFRPTGAQQWLFRTLTAWVWVAAASLALTAAGTLLLDVAPTVGLWALVPGVAGMIVTALAAPVLVVSNLPLAWRVLERHLALRRLGLQGTVRMASWAHQRLWNSASALRLLVIASGGGFIAAAILAWHRYSEAASASSWLLLVGMVLVFMGGLLLATELMERKKAELEMLCRATELRRALESLRANRPRDARIAVPTPMLEHAARIERAQIVMERNTAILASAAASMRYAVVMNVSVARAKRQLPIAHRIEVERLLAQLATIARADRQSGAELNTQWARSADGSVDVEYSLNSRERRITIHSLAVSDPRK
jgi:hypothetical protein